MLVIGIGLLLAAVVALLSNWRSEARRRRMRRIPTSSVRVFASAMIDPKGLVEINGRVLEGPGGTFESPIGRRSVVWCRVHHEKRITHRWSRSGTAVHSVPFHVRDGSGGIARIDAAG